MTRLRERLGELRLPVQTPRLDLVLPSASLVRKVRPLLDDPEVSRWLLHVPYPYTARDGRDFVGRARRGLRSGTMLALWMVDRASGAPVGGVGLHDLNDSHRHAELGYWVARVHWGRGYGPEAVEGMLSVAFRTLRLHRLDACVFKGNVRSEQLLRRAGFRFEGVRREAFWKNRGWADDRLFGLLDTEYIRRRRRIG